MFTSQVLEYLLVMKSSRNGMNLPTLPVNYQDVFKMNEKKRSCRRRVLKSEHPQLPTAVRESQCEQPGASSTQKVV